MNLTAGMQCCKPSRQFAKLDCDAAMMVWCLSNHCAQLPTLEERRAFAAKVACVDLITQAGLQQHFRSEVKRLYAQAKEGT